MVSTHNPFRTPAATPTPTGASTASDLFLSPQDNANHARESGGSSTTSPPASAGRSPTPEDRSVNDLLTEEFPPAYTPAPNVYEGEATLELGPRRPFQNAVPVPPQNQPPWLSPQSTAGGSWTAFPGGVHREASNIYTRPAPPPVHPSARGRRPSSTPPTDAAHLSDFARDFYAAGAAEANAGVLGGSSAQYRGEPSGTSASSAGTRYAPPAGEPQRRGTRSGPSSPMREQVADDGRPTEKPVPGHPLMRHGKVLIYPQGYECHKCSNTGYKNYDPSHPCSRCWDKYAKAYAGPLAYAPWGGEGSSRSSFQRPLPQFRAPQTSLHQQSSSYSGLSAPPRNELGRSASTSRVGGGYPGASARVIPIAGGGVPVNSYLDPLRGRGTSVFPPSSWYASPSVVPMNGVRSAPGNAPVYSPGDPRIGGRLCWRCGGDGKTSFLIFDEETCRICNGIGRTFV